MTTTFLQLRNQVSKLLTRAEDEALEDGIDILSPEFLVVFREFKRKILVQEGISLEEYEGLEERLEQEKKKETMEGYLEGVKELSKDIKEELQRGTKKLQEGYSVKIDTLAREANNRIQGLVEKTDVEKKELLGEIKALVNELKRQRSILEEQLTQLEKEFNKKDIRSDSEIYNLKTRISELPTIEIIENLKKEIEGKIPEIGETISLEEKKRLQALIKYDWHDVIQNRIKDLTPRLWHGMAMGLRMQIDANKVSVSEINLSSQCDGSTTVFSLGRVVKSIIVINLNGTIASYTLNAARTEITLTFAPDSGETLKAITLV